MSSSTNGDRPTGTAADRAPGEMSHPISHSYADDPENAPTVPHPDERPGELADAQDQSEGGEKVGVFAQHAWLVPATVVFAVIAAFALMLLMTWLGGGTLPF